MTRLHSAQQRTQIIEEGRRGGFDILRSVHIAGLRLRDEVLASSRDARPISFALVPPALAADKALFDPSRLMFWSASALL